MGVPLWAQHFLVDPGDRRSPERTRWRGPGKGRAFGLSESPANSITATRRGDLLQLLSADRISSAPTS